MNKRGLGLILIAILLCTSVVFVLNSCGGGACSHITSEWITDTEATCKSEGAKHKECIVCQEILEIEGIAITNHSVVVDSGIPATDTKDGFSEGAHCSTCGDVIVAQVKIPATITGTDIRSDLLMVNEERIFGTVSYSSTSFSFLDDITVNDDASYVLARDKGCENPITSKVVDINVGENIFYICVSNGNQVELYTVTLRRLPQYMYLVNFDSNGGNSVEPQSVYEGEAINAPVTEKPGYEFVGWQHNGETATFPYTVYRDTQFKAIFNLKTYSITYELNGGENIAGNPDDYTMLSQDITLQPPSKEGYRFEGWFSDSKFQEQITKISSGSCGDVTLYAKWVANTYTVTFKAIDGTFIDTMTVTYGSPVALPIFENPLYEFVGWYEGEQKYSDGIWDTARDVTLVFKGKSVFVVSDGRITDVTPGKEDGLPKILEIPEIIDGERITEIGIAAFWGCKSLERVIIPDGVTSIGDYAFGDCTSLESVELPDEVTFIRSTAFEKTAVEYNAHDNALYLGNSNNPYIALIKASNTSITSCNIHEDTKLIVNSAFSGCASLESVTIPNGVKSIGGYAFSGCTSLESAVILDGVTSIGDYAFYRCASLESIDIPDSVTSIGSYAFGDCTCLVNVSLSDGLLSIGGAVFNNTAIKYNTYDNALYLGSSDNPYLFLVKAKDTSLGSCNIHSDTKFIEKFAFLNCTRITDITIPAGVISIGAFNCAGCASLVSISVDKDNSRYKSVDGILYSKDGTVLIEYPRGKTNTGFIIPRGVTSVGEYAFWSCGNLTSITIPAEVTSIADGAFERCTSIESVYYESTESEWKDILIGTRNDCLAEATRYYYSETEPPLNAGGTAYDGNYWHYDEQGNIVVWSVKD